MDFVHDQEAGLFVARIAAAAFHCSVPAVAHLATETQEVQTLWAQVVSLEIQLKREILYQTLLFLFGVVEVEIYFRDFTSILNTDLMVSRRFWARKRYSIRLLHTLHGFDMVQGDILHFHIEKLFCLRFWFMTG